jgi:cation transporter-like permease
MMLELLAYVALLLVVIPGLLLAVGKLIAVYSAKLSLSEGAAPRATSPAPQNYETLHQRLVAAAEAHPFLPKRAPRSKRGEAKN